MANIYQQAFDILEQLETEADYHEIVTLILKIGYNPALITLITE